MSFQDYCTLAILKAHVTNLKKLRVFWNMDEEFRNALKNVKMTSEIWINVIKNDSKLMTTENFSRKPFDLIMMDAIVDLVKSGLLEISYSREYEGEKIYAYQFLYMPENIQLKFLEICNDEKFLHKLLIEALGGMEDVYYRLAEAILNKNILKFDLYNEVKNLQECGRLSEAVWLFQRAIPIQKPTEEDLKFGFEKCVYELMKRTVDRATNPNYARTFQKFGNKTFNEWLEY